MRALLSVADRQGIAALARDLRALEVEMFATDGTREYLAGRGHRGRLGQRPDRRPLDRRRAGQDLPPRVYAGILARRDVPTRWPSSTDQGIGPIDLVVVNVKPFAPAVGVKLVGIDEAIEMIDVAGAALLGAAARNSAGVAAASDPSHYADRRGDPRVGWGQPRDPARLAAEAFSMVAAYHAEIAAYLNQISGNTFRAAWRSSSRRSTTCAMARTRTSGPRSTARRPTAAGRWPMRPSSRAIGRRSTTCSISTPRTASPGTTRPPPWPSSSTPTRSGLASDDELVEAYRHALETDPVASFGGIVGVNRELDGATAREIAANSYEAVVAPGFSERPSASCAARPASSCSPVPPDPTDGMRDYGIANLDFKRVAGGLLVESLDDLGLDRGTPPGRHQATADAGGADRPAVRLAGGPPRPLERHRPGPQRRDGRHRGRPGVPLRCRSRSRCAGPATGPRRRSWPRTRTSRSRTASRPRPAPA